MSRRLELNFVDHRRGHWIGVPLLLIGLVGCVMVWDSHRSLSAQLAGLQLRLDNAERKLQHSAPLAAGKTASPVQQAQAREANAVLALLSLPWQEALRQIEQVRNPDVALLSLEPDLPKAVIRLGGEARSYQAVLLYMKALQGAPGLKDVVLQNHDAEARAGGAGLRFLITARWVAQP